MNADRVQGMIVTYRNGAPVRLGELGTVDRRRRGRADRVVVLHPGCASSARSRSASSASPAPTRSRWPTRSRRCCRSSRAELPASVHMDVLYDRSDTIRESYRDVQFTMAADAGARDHGDLRVPAQRVGHGHPEPRAAVLDRRHVRRDVHARLQPRQPVDDGAHPLGRLRRRRCDRDAGEHLPARRDGRGAADGLAGRVARDRLHHRVDDAVARRGVHPGAVHGRRARAAVPRVLGHDLRGDSDLRRRLGDADADAVQPVPEEAAPARREASRFGRVTERAFDRLLHGYDRTLQVVLRHRPATMAAFVVVLVADGACCSSSCRKASFRTRTPIRSP